MGVGAHVCVHVCVRVCVHVHVHEHVYKCRTADQFGTRMKKISDATANPVPDQANSGWHFLVRYQIEIMDASMPISVVVSSMPVPSYEYI